jgi:hypothetical protein
MNEKPNGGFGNPMRRLTISRCSVSGREMYFLAPVFLVFGCIAVFTLLKASICTAQVSGEQIRFDVRVESGYERTALNYNLLLVDTTALAPDSLEQLRKSGDTRTEPAAGLRATFDNTVISLSNGLYYSTSGWREQFDGGAGVFLSPAVKLLTNARFEYRQLSATEDSLLADYWTLTGDARILTRLSSNHTVFIRADWDRLQYPGEAPSFGDNFDRVRARAGWQWKSNNFDFADIAVGMGRRLVPDSTDREYTAKFAAAYFDFTFAERHRVALDAAVDFRDYRSADPADDYVMAATEWLWDYRPHLLWLLHAHLRWDFWDFRAQDEVSFDFHELEPALEVKIPLGEDWAFRPRLQYRLSFAADAAFSQADYRQSFGIVGLEYIPSAPLSIDARAGIGYRDYQNETFGYSDYTILRFDFTGYTNLSGRLALWASVDYEKEYHTVVSDDTDFLFFSVNLGYLVFRSGNRRRGETR